MRLLIAFFTLVVVCGISLISMATAQDDSAAVDAVQSESESDAIVESVQKATEDARLKFRLWDGTIVIGNPSINSIHVKTRFGLLDVPLDGVINIRPGFGNLPELKSRVDDLLKLLEDREFQKRRTASEDLLGMGPTILNYLKVAPPGSSAERKKMMETIIAELSEQASEQSEDPYGDNADEPLMVEDSVSAGDFVVVGVIEEKEYSVSTDYGTLTIPLSRIRIVERNGGDDTRTVRKKLNVAGMDFFQTSPEKTGIRIRKGDRIRIKAGGTVLWTNWGNVSSNPDGIATHGQWNGMNCGMLAAQVGDKGSYVAIGKDKEFIADADGELVLGVAMQDNFAAQQGYQWGGEYDVQIIVEGLIGD